MNSNGDSASRRNNSSGFICTAEELKSWTRILSWDFEQLRVEKSRDKNLTAQEEEEEEEEEEEKKPRNFLIWAFHSERIVENVKMLADLYRVIARPIAQQV